MTKNAEKIGANSCRANALRRMPECANDAAYWQTVEGERVALHRPDGNSLNGRTFAGASYRNPSAGNDMQASAARAANSLSGKLPAANSLRGFGPHTGREKAAEIGKNLTRIPTLVRWCKFNLVGAVGILVQFGVLFLLKSVMHFNYLAATALAVEVAVVHNFFWHERFTWAERTKSERDRFGRTRSERVRPSWGGRLPGAEARNLPGNLFAALKSVREYSCRPFGTRALFRRFPALTCRANTFRRFAAGVWWFLLHRSPRNSVLTNALKRCATQKRATEKCAIENCVTEARARPKSKAAGKSARSTQTDTYKLIQECANQECANQKLRSSRFGRFLRFNFTTGLVSIGGNLGMMRVMVGREHMNYLAANGIAIAVCSLVNFLVSDGWVFGD